MRKCHNVVKIEYKGQKHIQGTAFILPTSNAECMFLITAHHIFDYADEIHTDLITVTGQDKELLIFDYDSDYYTDKSLDVCIIRIKYNDSFNCPLFPPRLKLKKQL